MFSRSHSQTTTQPEILKDGNDKIGKKQDQSLQKPSTMKELVQISILFLIVRVIQYTLVLVTPLSSFDNSTKLLLNAYVSKEEQNKFINRHLLNKLLSWDSVFFAKGMMSKTSLPQYEHEFAFSITWTTFLKYIYRKLHLANEVGTIPFYSILRMGIILENILHFSSVIVLYHLTYLVFSPKLSTAHNRYATQMAKWTAILQVFTGAGGFLLGIYSEPLSCLLSFVGMTAREYCTKDVTYKYTFKNPFKSFILYTIISTLCFSIATWNRSNCILLGIFYVYDLLQLIKIKSYRRAIQFPLLSGLLMLISIVIQQYYIPYKRFCPERGEWCMTSFFPNSYLSFITRQSLYSYIQSHYWNVGFMTYWTPNNIPNFLFALPNLIIVAYSSFYYSWIYPLNKLKPLIVISMAFWILMLFIANTQIINRVVTFIPLHLWYISDRLVKNFSDHKIESVTKDDDLLVKYYIYWLVMWLPVQTILFASFLPPA
ncbi:similar to Saccharomyces cerevisiae YBR004C GPI18 Functional ortholog of human PIG-V [Maudiozyma saulgeensis]|uniref:GPI mannosyltransferase 2 n=1 Tax=Maudiozyma saulgeensis TaxID=1789683 RepID=A0A1X7R6W9_9SACH|nr:similar to Saccharomyces cerevisiae YBR004C GPI18 Functional ortholog of human PIG-V [Kazachstania saulgeensis]